MKENVEAKVIKISIITVSYNAVRTIEQTISSVVNQTYPNVEYIIIDGGSTDGTVEIIKEYADKVSYWVSEPDHGVYDAMNKGIELATGDYIYFLGSDDWIFAPDAIESVVNCIYKNPGYDFYCGKIILYDSVYRLTKKGGGEFSLEDIKSGSMCPHQGMFTNAGIMKQKFSMEYKYAADFEFFLRNIVQGKTIRYMDFFIAYYNVYGMSSDHKLYDEYDQIILKFCGEEYVPKVRVLKKYALNEYAARKLVKKVLCCLIGRKYFMYLLGWKRLENAKT